MLGRGDSAVTNEQLCVEIQSGRGELMPELWEQVQRLVGVFARRYFGKLPPEVQRRTSVDDLEQAGYCGFAKAVDGFDADGGYSFSRCLWLHCLNEFRRELGIRTSKRDASMFAASLDVPLGDDEEGAAWVDSIPDTRPLADEIATESVYHAELHKALEQALARLSVKRRNYIRFRFYDGLTLEETAALCGCSKQAASAAIDDALWQLRTGKDAAALFALLHPEFLDPDYVYRELMRCRL